MISQTLAVLQQVTQAEIVTNREYSLEQAQALSIDSICTDTRKIKQGDCYLALKGQRFDGHDFCQQAIDAGAALLIVSQQQDIDIPQLVVADTRIALGQLGAHNKQLAQVKTIAVTGSAGKTTVKEMLAAICRQSGQTLATKGNFNNDIGAPLTLLELTETDEYAVIELGANHIGEIAYTVNLVKPDVALVNNVSAAHLEGFGSIAGVVQAKGEIYSGLSEHGRAIVNADLDCADDWLPVIGSRPQLRFSTEPFADVYLVDLQLNENLCAEFSWVYRGVEYPVSLNIPGIHNANNALAAISCALAIGIEPQDISDGLTQAQTVAGRVKPIRLGQLTVIDDSYNANQGSMQAAIDLLKHANAKRLFVMGDMGEMGDYAEDIHKQVGEYALNAQLDGFYVKGDWVKYAQPDNRYQFDSFDALNQTLIQQIDQFIADPQHNQKVVVLIKGSRSTGMDKLVDMLVAHYQSTNSVEDSAC
ncbi:UDP-N-acetylmuramoyl-tripeptide--D-alanyl-D-alanine ligase [Catenovulum agarivorans DS-2]|uniref:UDP-N-acetylmuramoyl-tripeptide--D-alanyl-D-alanine ligase n=1 Tax=Catenovulum agarivorans DS-2 TaxID=1328313 RepID=W7QQE4_9ALTE|nr:UDP-N-acetylmuramoyl-tripeptide--D-alanyl-D-alanine ligase [Catenovulum agarivorans]EWH11197.1 UDP-N-acetylmuramoyl-tripeptide--D-alanyl-D-alanine ligase [Catenovulum agarivorans DS-2]